MVGRQGLAQIWRSFGVSGRATRDDDRLPAKLIPRDVDHKSVKLQPGVAPTPRTTRRVIVLCHVGRLDRQALAQMSAEQFAGMPTRTLGKTGHRNPLPDGAVDAIERRAEPDGKIEDERVVHRARAKSAQQRKDQGRDDGSCAALSQGTLVGQFLVLLDGCIVILEARDRDGAVFAIGSIGVVGITKSPGET